ncbi:MAG: MFS transporter [Cytophagales bacterium]|nr:MFS transporter [Cytophagales bacterium]MCA6366923.1 MFS transporter [Cytophagales bacterium]MCA6370979.1 MFS transporter [Cytophagales bacterium]MCA6375396.1 MFS transporter [Cytophagales bacterium]MCA6382097.1 MFS transporter [Cytophagales bacterium]
MSPSSENPYAALLVRDFRFFILARLFVTLAIMVQAVVVGWQVYEITRDPLSLGLIGLAEAIPAITVSLYAGHLADVVQRKKIILVCVVTLVLCSMALLYFTMNVGAFILARGALPIYAVIFLSGIARGFLSPANFSFMPQLVDRSLYQNAIVWNSTLWEGAAVGGPIIGGLVFGFYGITAAYTVDVVLVFAGLLCYLAIPSRALPPVSEEQGIFDKIKAGIRFVFKNQIVLSAISLDLFAVLFGGAVALLPIFADEILNVGKEGLGFLRSAQGIGAVIMAVYLTRNPIKKNIGKILLWCVAGFGLCMIGFGLSKLFWLSMALLILSGMFDCVSVIVRSTLIHTLTPENMKGRVSAVNSIFIGSSNEIGSFESGVAARLMGVVPSVIFGGLMTLGVVGITSWKADKLRSLHNVQ